MNRKEASSRLNCIFCEVFDNEEIPMNPFTGMKEFSRILFELKYFY